MAKTFIKVEGGKEFNDICSLLPSKFQEKIVRDIARKGGRVIVKQARKIRNIPGQLGKDFASEMIVGNDKQNKSGVVVTVRGGRSSRMMTNSAGENYIPAAVGRHMTRGAKQKKRATKKNANRGLVNNRYADPIEEAGQIKANEAMNVMQNETVKIMQKHVQRYAKRK